MFADLNPVTAQRPLIILLKSGIFLASASLIVRKVILRPDFSELAEEVRLEALRSENLAPFLVLLLLLPVNWLLETAKWKYLLRKIDPQVGWGTALRSVMSGVTISFFTPNRVGEFAGRIMHLRMGYRIKAAIASVIGSMNQLMITLTAGGMGLFFSLPQLLSDDSGWLPWIRAFTLVLMALIIIAWFQVKHIASFGYRLDSLRRWSLYFRIFEIYSFRELLNITGLSLSRYITFSLQLWMALMIFGTPLPLTEGFRYISLIFLVITVVPSFALSDLTLRGSVALYFLAPLSGNSAGILAATTMVWLINLAIPALAGSMAVYYFKWSR